jgi:hypothetical protein
VHLNLSLALDPSRNTVALPFAKEPLRFRLPFLEMFDESRNMAARIIIYQEFQETKKQYTKNTKNY